MVGVRSGWGGGGGSGVMGMMGGGMGGGVGRGGGGGGMPNLDSIRFQTFYQRFNRDLSATKQVYPLSSPAEG